ncbi:DUF924 family protein [Allosphingosinicella sp.]|uniref:DUF924 family protein n=1 Tax=Allosphingosinicella sp. TaxID=2823234 RepID=UPI002F07410A
MGWARDVLGFWFSRGPGDWWKPNPAFDSEIAERYRGLWDEQRGRQAGDFLEAPDHSLAAIILFDQFPRNMFRGHADQFATDHLALAIAEDSVERGFDDGMAPERRGFLYMPFQHSEDLRDQKRSLLLFAALGEPEQLRFARLHHDVIERFGRFPHRIAALGRKPRQDEIAAGNVVPW